MRSGASRIVVSRLSGWVFGISVMLASCSR
jgi:hypothetical protein